MSVWTHVTGNIRYDGLAGIQRNVTKEALKGMLGKTWVWEDDIDAMDACTVPEGSEGSIQYIITEYDKGLPWATVSVYGDLRDYDDVKELTDWFTKVTVDSGYMIRDAILRISVEGGEMVALTHDAETNTIKILT